MTGELPRGAALIERAAVSAGWDVDVARMRDSLALRMRREERRAVAVWTCADFYTAYVAPPIVHVNTKGLRAVLAGGTAFAPRSLSVRRRAAARIVPPVLPGYPCWGRVHVADAVRGGDARVWTVVARGQERAWIDIRHGEPWSEAEFMMRLPDTDREVSVWRRLDAPVDLVARADHSDIARACDALIAGGLDIELLEETLTAPADPFESVKFKPRIENGRYVLPDPETGADKRYTRASTMAKTISDDYMLEQWRLRQVAKGMALRPDLVALAASADPVRDRADLQSCAGTAMTVAEADKGANLGSSLHTFTRRLDAGEPVSGLRPPMPLDRDLAAYATTMKQNGLSCVESERTVLIPSIGCAGTFDRIVSQPKGVAFADPMAIFDLKTADKIEYGWLEILIQLAIYSRATHMWDPAAGCWVSMPAVDQTRALVLHLPVSKVIDGEIVSRAPELYALDIAWGWQQVLLSTHVRAARRDAKKHVVMVKPSDPAALALWNVQCAGSRADLAKLWDRYQKAGLWTDEVGAAGMARLAELETATA